MLSAAIVMLWLSHLGLGILFVPSMFFVFFLPNKGEYSDRNFCYSGFSMEFSLELHLWTNYNDYSQRYVISVQK